MHRKQLLLKYHKIRARFVYLMICRNKQINIF